MRNTRLTGHALDSEGKPFVLGQHEQDGHWVRPYGYQSEGVALCECGVASGWLTSNAARQRWHRAHKDEIRQLSRPILAVDVDGVLNALSNGTPPKGWEDHKVMQFRVRCNPAHGAALLALAAEQGAELTWCTTWEELANEHIGPLVGLPKLPVVPMEPGRRGRKFSEYVSVGTTKAAAMRAYAGERPFCWLDDEHDAARELRDCPVPHRVVRVEASAGLQPHHLRKAAAWLAGIRAAKPGSKENRHGN